MSTRATTHLAGAALLVALVAAGCGGSGSTETAGGSTVAPAPSAPAPTKATTTTAPAAKIKATPQCRAISRLNLAMFAVPMAPAEKQESLIDVMNRQANTTRELVPEFSDAINQQILAVRKGLTGTVTPEEKATGQKAGQIMAAWFNQNCKEPSGTPAAPSTTSPAAALPTTTRPR